MYNKLEHVECDLFRGLVNLKYIDLSGNELQYLHPDTFLGLPNLQQLNLRFNPGLQIPTDRNFIKSHSLSFLKRAGCDISSVSIETFANVCALKLLVLSYTNLKTLDVNVLKALPKLSELYLGGNPLQCDCQLKEVWRWCEDHNISTGARYEPPYCHTPSEVKEM